MALMSYFLTIRLICAESLWKLQKENQIEPAHDKTNKMNVRPAKI